MKLAFQSTPRRAGFTLIEMLLVIAIIIVLVAMLLPAIFGAIRKANETKVRNEISQLTTAVQIAQREFNVPYFPSRIRLAEKYGYYNSSDQLDKDSIEFLIR